MEMLALLGILAFYAALMLRWKWYRELVERQQKELEDLYQRCLKQEDEDRYND